MKVLTIAYWLLPVVRPQAILLDKMLTQWDKIGLEAHVVSAKAGENRNRPNIFMYHAKNIRLIKNLKKVISSIYLDYFSIVKEAYKIGKKVKPDIIYTFAKPHLVSIIGCTLKRKLGIPWIAHFSDPWVDNPYENYRGLKRSIISYLENKIIENCDAIVFVSKETLDMVMSKYSFEMKKKAYNIPHCFSPQMYPRRERFDKDKIIFRHIGNFYGNRSIEPLVASLAQVRVSKPDLIEKITVECVGGVPSNVKDLLKQYRLEDIIQLRPPVSYIESLELMVMSDVLISIDAPAKVNIFLPSKLIDYLGAKKPILAITPLNGSSAELIQLTGGIAVNPDNITGITAAIIEYAEAFFEERLDEYEPKEDIVGNFSVEATTDKLVALMRTFCAG